MGGADKKIGHIVFTNQFRHGTVLASKGDAKQMEKRQRNLSNTQLAEIERLIDEFKGKFKARTSNADDFITIHEIERMWGELQQNTLKIYSDMLCNLMGSIDEGDLIRKKKENTHKKE